MIKSIAVGAGSLVLVLLTASGAGATPVTAASPAPVAASSGPVTAYVANIYAGTVTPIRAATRTALKPIMVGVGDDAMAITPNGQTLYVANVGAGTVTPVPGRPPMSSARSWAS